MAAMDSSGVGRVRFGVFEVDIRAGELRKQGVKVKLQEQPFQILQMLLEHAGHVVTREELRHHIWPADTFVDFDHGLYNAVKRLREALGDSADNPRFIETLSRRGYRFIGQVSEGNDIRVSPVASGSAALAASASIVGNLAVAIPAPDVGTDTASAPVATDEPITFRKPATPVALPVQEPVLTRRNLWLRVLAGCMGLLLVLGLLAAFSPVREKLLGRISSPPIRSLAVLPLQNLSGDPAQEYFADGMTEELITELSRIGALKVISRTSVMRYKKTDKSLPEIARELNADGIVEGSVLRSGDRVRITVQLIYAPEDKNLWAQSYDRDLKDLLATERVVASTIADELIVKMTPAERAQLRSVRPVNLDAHEAYLQGRYHLRLATDALFKKDKGELHGVQAKKAEEYFRQSIREDPNYAPAYLGLWEARCAGPGPLPPPNATAGERPMLLKALQLDDSLAEAHRALAMLLKNYDWDWAASEEEYRRAIQLEPSNADAHAEYAFLLADTGRIEQALQEFELSQSLDPKNDHLADAFYLTRRFDRAIKLYQSQAQMDPDSFLPHMQLAYIYALTGRHAEAVSEWQRMLDLLDYKELSAVIGRAFRAGGYENALRVFVRELEASSHTTYVPAWYIASIYAYQGDRDRAFAWLEKAYKEREDGVDALNEPRWDPLRSDPRFTSLLRRVGLPD